MALEQLRIDNVRNLHQESLLFSPGLTVLSGANGSGKTSVLEALYYLSRGYSFRTSQWRDLLQKSQQELVIHAQVRRQQVHHLGSARSRSGRRLRLDGQNLRGVASLTRLLPLLLLQPYSQQLLQEGPKLRRQFMDWGVFYQQTDFIDHWRRYQQALKHRNSALRGQSTRDLVSVWEPAMLSASQAIDAMRQDYCQQLQTIVTGYFADFFPQYSQLTLNYQRGWPEEQSLAELWQHWHKDREVGYTRYGPQKADLSIRVDQRLAKDYLSQGQQKMLAFLLMLAQSNLYQQHTRLACLLMMDDLNAELDQQHRQQLLATISQINCQCIITAIEPKRGDYHHWQQQLHYRLDQGHIAPTNRV